MDCNPAGKHLIDLLERVHAKQPPSEQSPQEEEEMTHLIKAMRRELRQGVTLSSRKIEELIHAGHKY